MSAIETPITRGFFSSMLGRRVETDTAAPDGHSGGGFTVADTGRVYRRSRLAGHEYYRVLDCVTAKARTANRR